MQRGNSATTGRAELVSPKSEQQESQTEKSLRLLDEYFATATEEDKEALVRKVNAIFQPDDHLPDSGKMIESQEELWKLALHQSGSEIDPIKFLMKHYTITRS